MLIINHLLFDTVTEIKIIVYKIYHHRHHIYYEILAKHYNRPLQDQLNLLVPTNVYYNRKKDFNMTFLNTNMQHFQSTANYT